VMRCESRMRNHQGDLNVERVGEKKLEMILEEHAPKNHMNGLRVVSWQKKEKKQLYRKKEPEERKRNRGVRKKRKLKGGPRSCERFGY